MNLLAKLGGRKFLLAVLGVIAIALHQLIGMDEQTVYSVGGVLVAYILGQSYSDGASGGATSSTATLPPPTPKDQ